MSSNDSHDDVLTTQNGEDCIEEVTKQPERSPLPKLQLFTVFLIQFAEPVTATVIYPFVNQFVRETGVTNGDETKTGYYAGVIESTFFISETLTVFSWGWLSDRLGRKPVLLLGPLGLGLSMLGFGLSKSFWPLVYYRCFQGFFNGNIGVSKSVIAEITDASNIGDAYALAPLMWNTGVTIGPILGGVLSNPSLRWPDTLGKIALLSEHPYFLPCAAAALITFISFGISAVAMKETLHSAKGTSVFQKLKKSIRKSSRSSKEDESATPLLYEADTPDYGSSMASSLEDGSPIKTQNSGDRPPRLSDLFVWPMLMTLMNYGLLAFIDMSYAALVPLTYSTPIQYGGLGMDPYHIGVIMGSFGFSNGVIQAFLLGPAMRRYGPRKIYIFGLTAYLFAFNAFPIANYFARSAGGIDWRVVTVLIVQFLALSLVSPCYASMAVMIVRNAPSKALLGSANGTGQMITSGMRSLAPAIASSLFAISLERNLLGGYMVYYVLLGLTVLAMRASHLLPPDKS